MIKIIELLLSFGADPDQRGINDYTPLHIAVRERNALAVERLLKNDADPRLRTRIDEYETPSEIPEKASLQNIAALLAAQEARLSR